jgi:WD40-like Beta Propeller Repeat
MLFMRWLNGTTVKALAGTQGGKFPFWSPDGKSVAFFADQQLKRLDLAGGPPMTLAQAPDARGGTWSGDTILFTPYIYDGIGGGLAAEVAFFFAEIQAGGARKYSRVYRHAQSQPGEVTYA